jgi:hypothetical protein
VFLLIKKIHDINLLFIEKITNKKKKQRKNGNIYKTPVFDQIDFIFFFFAVT